MIFVVTAAEAMCRQQRADMNIILTYYKCMDDWEDEKKKTSYLYGSLLKKEMKQLEKVYPNKVKVIADTLQELREGEIQKNLNADQMAGIFGEIMGELFLWKEDEWKNLLYQLGFYLGKFIYLYDACMDWEADRKKGSYNPVLLHFGGTLDKEAVHRVLTPYISRCVQIFERLPIVQDGVIIRNILYSGVWQAFHEKYGDDGNGSIDQ